MAIWDFSVIYMSIYVPSRNVCQPFLSASQRLSVSLRPTLTAPLLRIATPAQPHGEWWRGVRGVSAEPLSGGMAVRWPIRHGVPLNGPGFPPLSGLE